VGVAVGVGVGVGLGTLGKPTVRVGDGFGVGVGVGDGVKAGVGVTLVPVALAGVGEPWSAVAPSPAGTTSGSLYEGIVRLGESSPGAGAVVGVSVHAETPRSASVMARGTRRHMVRSAFLG
jgi:hypothetical protein